MDNKIAILVPCYNEENTISKVGSALRKTGYRFLILNDGSTDMTTKLLKINNFPHYNSYPNMGKGYVIKLGAKMLIEDGFDYILIMDADGQHDMRDITAIIAYLETYPTAKIIIGNRLWNPKGMSLVRKSTNKFMSWVISRLTKQNISDSQCGFKLIHRSIFKLPSKKNRFEYETEQLLQVSKKKIKIHNIPIKCIYFKDRKSKMNPIKDTIRWIKLIWRFIWEK